jgi:hypothetical protein
MMYLHPYTLHEIELLRDAQRPPRHPRRRQRSTWRARVRARRAERPVAVPVLQVEAEDVTAQLVGHGC